MCVLRPPRARRPWLPGLAALAALLGCSEVPTDPCSSDQDCGPCERCVDGSCEEDPAQLNGWGLCQQEPDAAWPDAVERDGAAVDAATPEGAAPDSARPDTPAPDGAAPDAARPDATAPDGAAPDTAAPDRRQPDSSAPDSAARDRIGDDATPADAAVPDTAPVDAARPDVGPLYEPCEALLLPCLDPGPANVIEAPTEMSFADAMESAQANQTVQARGLRLGAGWWVPPYVTLRGCDGATIEGGIAFEGSGGTVEGFEVTGQGAIVANQTGAYVIRRNRVRSDDTGSEAGISARSIDALVYANVSVVIEQNAFSGRRDGIWVITRYDTGTHAVHAVVRNNTFHAVEYPIRVDENGLVGEVEVAVEHNTFVGFTDALTLNNVAAVTSTSGNLYADGGRAVAGNSQFEAHFSFVWEVTTASALPPFAGSFATGDPAFADAAHGDLRLTGASAVIDVIPAGTAVPGTDYFGCARPVAYAGAAAMADCGAIEAQP